jgi:hypothetical protein
MSHQTIFPQQRIAIYISKPMEKLVVVAKEKVN